MQSLAVKAIRRDPACRGISLPYLRSAIARVEEQYGLSHILARNHQLKVGGRRLYLLKVVDDQTELLEIPRGGPISQQAMQPILEPFLSDLTFGSDGLAAEWTPLPNLYGETIVLNPNRRFGQPIHKESGVLVSALVSSAYAEGSYEAAAELHGVSPQAVKAALRFSELLHGHAA